MKITLVDDEQIYLDKMARICREFSEKNRLVLRLWQLVPCAYYINGITHLEPQKKF